MAVCCGGVIIDAEVIESEAGLYHYVSLINFGPLPAWIVGYSEVRSQGLAYQHPSGDRSKQWLSDIVRVPPYRLISFSPQPIELIKPLYRSGAEKGNPALRIIFSVDIDASMLFDFAGERIPGVTVATIDMR